MRRLMLVAVLALLPLGCLKAVTKNTLGFNTPLETQIKLVSDGPIMTQAKVETDSPPTRTASRVVTMPLDGSPACVDGPKVALIDVDGLLLNQNMAGLSSVGDNPVSLFKEKLDAAACQPGVCAVLLRINTPGGAVNASDVMFQELQNFRWRTRLPVVACVLDVAAGGGYFLAAGCDAIVAHPTSIIGGVGVVWNSYSMHRALGVQSVDSQVIKAGEHIDMGSTLNLYSKEVEKMLKGMVDEYHNHFKARLRQVRPRVPEKCTLQGEENVDPFDGRVLAAGQGVACGLVDRIGYLEDAAALARDLAKQPMARLVLCHRANDPGYSAYAVTPNTPIQNTVMPISIPGIDRTKLPAFLFMWLPEPTMDRLSGR